MQKKITIVDYGLGNIYSVSRTFLSMGCNVEFAQTPEHILAADFLVLPGVGAFKKGMYELHKRNLVNPILNYAQKGNPLLGICLGMQMLFDGSEENGYTAGLGLLPGKVQRIVPHHTPIKVPHIGWSKLTINHTHPDASLHQTLDGLYAYFVHSFHPIPLNTHLLASSEYRGVCINAMVMHHNIVGCQFHPEKSADNFISFLKKISHKQALFEAN